MKNKSDSLPVILIVLIIVVFLWGYSQYNQKTMLKWDIEIYKRRLGQYEDIKVAEREVDESRKEYGEMLDEEREASK